MCARIHRVDHVALRAAIDADWQARAAAMHDCRGCKGMCHMFRAVPADKPATASE
jgi:hypothetical protein